MLSAAMSMWQWKPDYSCHQFAQLVKAWPNQTHKKL